MGKRNFKASLFQLYHTVRLIQTAAPQRALVRDVILAAL